MNTGSFESFPEILWIVMHFIGWIIITILSILTILILVYLAMLYFMHENRGNIGPYVVKEPGDQPSYRIHYRHGGAPSILKVRAHGANRWKTIKDSTPNAFISSFPLRDADEGKLHHYTILNPLSGKVQYRGKFRALEPKSFSGEFCFMAVSDIQIQDKLAVFQHWFMRIIKRTKPRFIVNCGDVVSKPVDEKFKTFFNTFKKVFSRWPVQSVIGNHDFGNDNGQDVRERYRLIPRNNEHYWYWFSMANVYFFMLSTNHLQGHAFKKQTDWLETELERASHDAKVIIACFHCPPFGPDYSSRNADAMKAEERLIKEKWIPLFSRFGVKLVISGHKHVYCREHHDGIWYHITGSFQGIREYPVLNEGKSICMNKHGITKITVGKNRIIVEALSLFGRKFDEYDMKLSKRS
ncbi:hypothetical protein GF325_05260 [Candidatus Bathyarchaeota archaeon]|nr:hypothetical protein [Candidatus Bathyarchaeota archaeon]